MPSPQAPIGHGPGPLVVTGVAWSGRGSIPRVDVSLDGGTSWSVGRLPGDESLELRDVHAFDANGQSVIEEEGAPKDVFEDPKSERCRQFLASSL